MKVTLLKDIAEYKAGTVDVTPERANYWKAIGVVKGSEKEEKVEVPVKAAPKKAAPKKAATKAKDISTSTIKKGKK